MKKIIELLKNNIKFISLLIIIFVVFNFELPYYVDAPGGLININDRYKIDNSYSAEGSINMTYVSEIKCTIPTFLLTKINKNFDLVKKEDVILNNETEEETDYRGVTMLKEANDNAIIIAYKKANKEIKIKEQKLFVTYIDELSKTDLKIKDQIIKVDNKYVTTKEEVYEIIKSLEKGSKVNIEVINNNKKYTRYAYILNNKKIGVMLTYQRKFEAYPNIKINYKKHEQGSSGGLMTSLAIYNSLVKEDITKGKKVAGTGTIDDIGNVGEIDGIKYKIKGAVKEKSDVFLAPKGNNYKEAIKLKEKNNYDIIIVEVDTFDDALNYLKKM